MGEKKCHKRREKKTPEESYQILLRSLIALDRERFARPDGEARPTRDGERSIEDIDRTGCETAIDATGRRRGDPLLLPRMCLNRITMQKLHRGCSAYQRARRRRGEDRGERNRLDKGEERRGK